LLDSLASLRVALLLRVSPETDRPCQPLAPCSGQALLSGFLSLQRSRLGEHVFPGLPRPEPRPQSFSPSRRLATPWEPSNHISGRWRSWDSHSAPKPRPIRLRTSPSLMAQFPSSGLSPVSARTTFDRCLLPWTFLLASARKPNQKRPFGVSLTGRTALNSRKSLPALLRFSVGFSTARSFGASVVYRWVSPRPP
jgi:hypothetical protein